LGRLEKLEFAFLQPKGTNVHTRVNIVRHCGLRQYQGTLFDFQMTHIKLIPQAIPGIFIGRFYGDSFRNRLDSIRWIEMMAKFVVSDGAHDIEAV
jgi:hypothetical protein